MAPRLRSRTTNPQKLVSPPATPDGGKSVRKVRTKTTKSKIEKPKRPRRKVVEVFLGDQSPTNTPKKVEELVVTGKSIKIKSLPTKFSYETARKTPTETESPGLLNMAADYIASFFGL
ncbi:hypothetical protein HDV02_006020 [Globomyces sp. JEL0801]|nr:hypothetical protein HDV02_006020 [Globomyces sp. JEL0801]